MPDISIQQVSKDFNYTLGTLRVYHTDWRLPMVKKYRRLFVTEETYKNLQSLHRDGIPFARYFEVYRKQQSGLGGEFNDYQTPEYLVLTKPDIGSQRELIVELQETIGEQERELERQEKRLKGYTLEILQLRNRIELLNKIISQGVKNHLNKQAPLKDLGDELIEAAMKDQVEQLNEVTSEMLNEAIRESNKLK